MDIQGTTENIHAYLSGQLTDAQVAAFEQWRSASEHNAQLVEEVRYAWDSALLYESPQFNSETAIDRMPFAQHTASAHVARQGNRYRLVKWAAAAAVILAIGTWQVVQLNSTPIMDVNGSYTRLINLEDGTNIFLDENASVSFPQSFASNERKVILDGEAYFDVAPDSDRKFVIQTDFAKVMVLGTEFDVIEDDDAQTVEVFVTEGKVRLQPTGSDVFLDVEVGESALYEHKTGKLQRNATPDMNHIAWHTKSLKFSKTPIDKVMRDIEAVYEVSIDYSNTGIKNCTFSSLYNIAEVTKILEDMSLVFGFRITSPQEGSYILNGGNCNPTQGN